MNKRLIIKVLIGLGLLLLILMAVGEYQWRTQGLGVEIDRTKALGVVTNSYGIRDQDLATIEVSSFEAKDKALLIKIAKDSQEIMRHSSDLDWIRKNGRMIYVRGYCAIVFESEKTKKPAFFTKKFRNTEERQLLNLEFEDNYSKIFPINIPEKTEQQNCYD